MGAIYDGGIEQVSKLHCIQVNILEGNFDHKSMARSFQLDNQHRLLSNLQTTAGTHLQQ
jgi:hypothetical protein